MFQGSQNTSSAVHFPSLFHPDGQAGRQALTALSTSWCWNVLQIKSMHLYCYALYNQPQSGPCAQGAPDFTQSRWAKHPEESSCKWCMQPQFLSLGLAGENFSLSSCHDFLTVPQPSASQQCFLSWMFLWPFCNLSLGTHSLLAKGHRTGRGQGRAGAEKKPLDICSGSLAKLWKEHCASSAAADTDSQSACALCQP